MQRPFMVTGSRHVPPVQEAHQGPQAGEDAGLGPQVQGGVCRGDAWGQWSCKVAAQGTVFCHSSMLRWRHCTSLHPLRWTLCALPDPRVRAARNPPAADPPPVGVQVLWQVDGQGGQGAASGGMPPQQSAPGGGPLAACVTRFFFWTASCPRTLGYTGSV